MGRFAGIRHALGAKHDQNDLLFGVVCMSLGALALSLSWLAFRGGSVAPRAPIGVGVNSNARLVGEVVADGVSVPIHTPND